MKKISFLGAGSWGTALAILCANNGHKVTIWSKIKSETDMLREKREHVDRLPGVSRLKMTLKKHAQDRILLYFRWLRRLSVRQQNWQNHLSAMDRLLSMSEKVSRTRR